MHLIIRTFALLSFTAIVSHHGLLAQELRIAEPVRFLALGDSYTIGASVPPEDRWPQQLYDSLVRRGYDTEGLTIIARSGWTTDDLEEGISNQNPPSDYNLVSLLIGVNDQYQGFDTGWYKPRFEKLLLKAIELAGGNINAVFVLSIPDYAYTPFGNGSRSISEEIDAFNNVNASIAQSYDIAYFDITPISREGLAKPGLVAQDGLHPSGLMYSKWVSMILEDLRVEDVTSLNGILPEKEVPVVAPNPTVDSVDFMFKDFKHKINHISIYNNSGYLIASLRSKGRSTISFNTSDLTAGLYYYYLVTENGRVITGKFIKI